MRREVALFWDRPRVVYHRVKFSMRRQILVGLGLEGAPRQTAETGPSLSRTSDVGELLGRPNWLELLQTMTVCTNYLRWTNSFLRTGVEVIRREKLLH